MEMDMLLEIRVVETGTYHYHSTIAKEKEDRTPKHHRTLDDFYRNQRIISLEPLRNRKENQQQK
jgi:hypothetical protein